MGGHGRRGATDPPIERTNERSRTASHPFTAAKPPPQSYHISRGLNVVGWCVRSLLKWPFLCVSEKWQSVMALVPGWYLLRSAYMHCVLSTVVACLLLLLLPRICRYVVVHLCISHPLCNSDFSFTSLC